MKKKVKYKKQQRLFEQKTNAVINVMTFGFFIVMTSVFPMFLTHEKYLKITYPKALFFWILTAAAAVSIFFVFVFFKKSLAVRNYYVENEPARRVSFAEWALLAFIGFSFISAAAASSNEAFASNLYATPRVKDVVWLGYTDRYEGFISFLCYGLTFFIIARFYKPKRLHLLIFAGSSILISVYGILQFLDIDIFGLFPFTFKDFIGSDGKSIYGPLSTHFRTTLGNIDIVSAYCAFTVVLFAALFSVSSVSRDKSKWQILYIAASAVTFALHLIAGRDASKVGILGAMVLLIPYWISNRERLGKILLVLSSWCVVYICYDCYLSALKKQYELNPSGFALLDQYFLASYKPGNTILFAALAVFLVAAGLCLLILLKKWAERPMKIAGIAFLPAAFVIGILFVLIMGARWSDDPYNIIWQAREILHGRLDDHFGSNRGWIWKSGFSVLFKHPFLGTGPDTFLYALGDHLQSQAVAFTGVVFDKAHNIFLQIAVCMGIPALLAYAAFIGGVFVPAVKKAFERPLLLAFGAAALSYTAQSFFCVEVPITTPLVWVALGVMAGEIRREKIGLQESEI